jgi:hypothetical protein
MANVILGLRINPEVKKGLAEAAKRRFTTPQEYLRQVITEAVVRDGGLDTKARKGVSDATAP